MAQDYIVLKEQEDTGMIAINKSVFESITEISVQEVDGAICIPNTRFSKPIQIKIVKNKLQVDADIKVRYGSKVNVISEMVQNRIYENIFFMTGYKPSDITVNVIGFDI